MRLQQSTWIEIGEYLKTSTGIILPTGSTEQHGPMGVLGTDTDCAQSIAWRVGELAVAMVGPTLTIGVSEHHMTFPGSMALRPSTYIALLRDWHTCPWSITASSAFSSSTDTGETPPL